jgi:hypothetical protein
MTTLAAAARLASAPVSSPNDPYANQNPPPPPGEPPPPPYGAQPQPGYGYGPPQGGYGYGGIVPPTLDEVFYKAGLNILLTIVTCGIWAIVWSYRTHEDLKKYNGDGLGGVAALIIAIFVSAVIMFTVPNEIQKMYERDGRQSPVTTLWGLWFLLPIIGNFIWYLKVQEALNDFWVSKGSRPPQ